MRRGVGRGRACCRAWESVLSGVERQTRPNGSGREEVGRIVFSLRVTRQTVASCLTARMGLCGKGRASYRLGGDRMTWGRGAVRPVLPGDSVHHKKILRDDNFNAISSMFPNRTPNSRWAGATDASGEDRRRASRRRRRRDRERVANRSASRSQQWVGPMAPCTSLRSLARMLVYGFDVARRRARRLVGEPKVDPPCVSIPGGSRLPSRTPKAVS